VQNQKSDSVSDQPCFNGHLTDEPELTDSLLVSFLHLFRKRTFKRHIFTGRKHSLSLNQQSIKQRTISKKMTPSHSDGSWGHPYAWNFTNSTTPHCSWYCENVQWICRNITKINSVKLQCKGNLYLTQWWWGRRRLSSNGHILQQSRQGPIRFLTEGVSSVWTILGGIQKQSSGREFWRQNHQRHWCTCKRLEVSCISFFKENN